MADAGDGRFVPGLHVTVTLLDGQGQEVGTYHLPFLWHPTMYHYGCNAHVPQAGDYTARVAIPIPAFPRLRARRPLRLRRHDGGALPAPLPAHPDA